MNSSISSSRLLIASFFAAVSAVLILLTGASEWLVRTQVAPQDTLARHVKLFAATSATEVAFGDSHIARGFDAQAPVVNLAYPSENIERMAWKAERYLERVPAPKAVLIQADPHLFASYRINEGLGEYPEMFSGNQNGALKAFSARYKPQLIGLWRSYFKNGGRIVSKIEMTSQGALLSPGDLSTWKPAGRASFVRNRIVLHQPVENAAQTRTAALYKKMVQAFVDHGATVCLASLPVSPDYREAIANLDAEHQSAWEGMNEFFHELAEAPRVKFVDHRDAVSDLTQFRDPDHLNKEGAIAYSPQLQKACFDSWVDNQLTAFK